MAKTARSRVALSQLKATLRGERAPRREILREVVSLDADLTALEAVELEVLAAAAAGRGLGAEASLFKIRGTEIIQRLAELAMQLAGERSLLLARTERANEQAALATRAYLNTRKSSIYGGSNEIQRNIIAKMVLGL